MRRILLAGVAAFLALAPLAHAAETGASQTSLDGILKAGVLRVGSTGDYKPFTYMDPKTGQFTGFDIDQAKSLADALGVKLKVVPTAWPDMKKDFQAGKFDIAMGGVSITLDRQMIGLFTQPYMQEGKTPIVRCADKTKYRTIADIDKPDVTVITNPGGTNEKFDRAHFKHAKITVFKDNTKVFDRVAAGKADVMITDASETRYQQKLHKGVLCSVHPDKPFDFAEKGYWMQRAPYLAAFVDEWLHQEQHDGAYKAIYDKWFK